MYLAHEMLFDGLLQLCYEVVVVAICVQDYDGKIWQVATTPEEALQIIAETPVWDSEVRKYAAL